MVRSLTSTLPSPLKSPVTDVMPVWLKWASTIVRSLMFDFAVQVGVTRERRGQQERVV